MAVQSATRGEASQVEPMLRAAGVEKSFGPTKVLRGADVVVRSSEIVAIMGRSGSGKSTLLHCLAGVLQPDGGVIEYAGTRLDRMSDTRRSALRRTEFGFVFQFGQLVPEISAVENVALPLLLGRRGRKDSMRKATSWLETLGLGGLENRRPGELSGGQAQRVAVARAMVTEPRLIFADEPTGSLDSATGAAVLEAFTTVVRDRGVSVVLVTHETRVADHADRRLVVHDGTVTDPAAVEPAGLR
jgi:putative ABC transport system ATP-binding protein